jgi:hypothetical protein
MAFMVVSIIKHVDFVGNAKQVVLLIQQINSSQCLIINQVFHIILQIDVWATILVKGLLNTL